MPLPYTTAPENRMLLVRAELPLTSASQAYLVRAAVNVADQYSAVTSRDQLMDRLFSYFYTNPVPFKRKFKVFDGPGEVNFDLCFMTFKRIAQTKTLLLPPDTKLTLVGAIYTIQTLLYSIVPVFWYLQEVEGTIMQHPQETLTALDDELLMFLYTQLCFSQES